MMSHRIGRLHNFSAGPGALPLPVLEDVRNELPVYRETGASVMEISHRSPSYMQIEASARERIRNLLGLTADWHILFLGGGASMQFHQLALNFLPPGGQAGYLLTGTWAKKAHSEAIRIGNGRVVASSADAAFNYIPDPAHWDLDSKDAYVHFTSNNTIYGTQFQHTPNVSCPLVCDASSDFLSRPIEHERYGLIYAGAQKNIGPAGVTVVLVRNDFLEKRNTSLPTMLDYGTHAAKCFNTPPVFAVYIVEKVLRWLEGVGGIPGIQSTNRRKADLLYGAIDNSEFYRGTAETKSRSLMNVTFRLIKEDLEATFIGQAAEHGLVALKGHRSVGGMRASIYNACSLKSVEALVAFMKDFEQRNG
ncbi:MAG: 3-phosphoserine/phosphohydroxythreonine transaminase [Rhodothermaceae bacterium]|nr:3-phosphoserine/phosphohydroxythreonine transaminase [Rhodothermaceae bacterium]